MPEESSNLSPREKTRREQIRKNQAAIQLLDFWSEGGEEPEQVEALSALKVAIDANRPGQRKHFP
jgi:hypothetical protein